MVGRGSTTLDTVALSLGDELEYQDDEDLTVMDNQELWKEHHGDTKSKTNDELAVFAASNWKSRRTRGRQRNSTAGCSNADMLALNAAKLQNTLALFNDAKKDKRNAEIDIVAKAARSKIILGNYRIQNMLCNHHGCRDIELGRSLREDLSV